MARCSLFSLFSEFLKDFQTETNHFVEAFISEPDSNTCQLSSIWKSEVVSSRNEVQAQKCSSRIF